MFNKFFKITLITTLVHFVIATDNSHAAVAGKYQFNINVGQDNPAEGETRTTNASLVKFAISTKPSSLRLVGGFTFLTGGGLSQGSFTGGPHLYPFGNESRFPIQPFLFAEGAFGIGSDNDELRYDAGYGLGLGIDFRFFKNSGLTFAVEQHNATEEAYRMWIGWHFIGN